MTDKFYALATKLVKSDAPIDRYVADIAAALRQAAADEREACAKIADEHDEQEIEFDERGNSASIARAIRARAKEQP